MIVFVHQPEYLPWLGFFDKLARCDTFVVYDDAQYQHGSFHNRNKIRNAKGWEWLTVPIMHGYPQTIKNVKVSGSQWKNKHLDAIKRNYQNATYFKDYFPQIQEAIESSHEDLLGLDLNIIEKIAEILRIKAKFIRSSEFPYVGKEKNEKLVSICKFIGAETYISGSGGKAYMNESLFVEANISVRWHTYTHPIYTQQYSGFEPQMSIIDLLFTHGPDAKEIILEGGTLLESCQVDKAAAPSLVVEAVPIN